jgi:hypothetical protein
VVVDVVNGGKEALYIYKRDLASDSRVTPWLPTAPRTNFRSQDVHARVVASLV